MLRERETALRKAVILFDMLVVSFSFFLTFFLRRSLHILYRLDIVPSARVVAEMTAPLRDYFSILIIIVPVWLFTLYINGMYKSLRTKAVLEVIWIIIKSSLLTTLVFGTFVFLFRLEYVSRVFFIMLLAISAFAIFVEKIAIFFIMHLARKKGYNYRKILIVGTGRRAIQFMQKIDAHPEWGIRIAGIVDYERINIGKIISGVEVLASLEEMPIIIHSRAVDEVVFLIPPTPLY